MERARKPSKRVTAWIVGVVITVAVLAGGFAVGFVYWGLSALGDPAYPDIGEEPPYFTVVIADASSSMELHFSERDTEQAGLRRRRTRRLIPSGDGSYFVPVDRYVSDRFCLLDDVFLVSGDVRLGIAVPAGTCIEADASVFESPLVLEP